MLSGNHSIANLTFVSDSTFICHNPANRIRVCAYLILGVKEFAPFISINAWREHTHKKQS